MTTTELKDLVTIVTALTGFVGAVVGIFKYFNYRSKKDLMEAVGTGFAGVVEALGSKDDVKRRAAAILLRRFFNPQTEFGVAGTPYANEAVSVIAAILREERSGNFQKLLADGLWHAGSLRHADLQKTNLQHAYLGAKGDRRVDLSGADFYRADLSDASLKRATAPGAIFYQARLAHTVFTGADLTGASFFEADLQGARFKDAQLEGADFRGARNVPPDVAAHLDADGRYRSGQPVARVAAAPGGAAPLRVFLSRPAVLPPLEQRQMEVLRQRLAGFGNVEVVELARHDYPPFSALAEVRQAMSGCGAVVVVGLGELEIRQGVWRQGSTDERVLENARWPSPWTQLEAGMAIGLDRPTLLVAPASVDSGAFAEEADGHLVFRLSNVDDLTSGLPLRALEEWYATARERART